MKVVNINTFPPCTNYFSTLGRSVQGFGWKSPRHCLVINGSNSGILTKNHTILICRSFFPISGLPAISKIEHPEFQLIHEKLILISFCLRRSGAYYSCFLGRLNNKFSEKTLNWHGFSNNYRVIPAIRKKVSTGPGGCYFLV